MYIEQICAFIYIYINLKKQTKGHNFLNLRLKEYGFKKEKISFKNKVILHFFLLHNMLTACLVKCIFIHSLALNMYLYVKLIAKMISIVYTVNISIHF